MGYSAMTFNLQLSSVAIALVCVLFFHISCASALSVWRNEVPAFDHLSKRDVVTKRRTATGGLKQCQTHARNCPGGYLLKRSRLTEKLLDREPLLPIGEDDAEQTKVALLEADEDLRRNVHDLKHELRNAMRYRLLDMLRSSSTESLEENKEDW